MYLFIDTFKIYWYSKVNKYNLDASRLILHTTQKCKLFSVLNFSI